MKKKIKPSEAGGVASLGETRRFIEAVPEGRVGDNLRALTVD